VPDIHCAYCTCRPGEIARYSSTTVLPSKSIYDAIKNGMNSDLNLTEVSPYNPTTKIAQFVSDFGFD